MPSKAKTATFQNASVAQNTEGTEPALLWKPHLSSLLSTRVSCDDKIMIKPGALTLGLHYRFAQNFGDVFEMVIKHKSRKKNEACSSLTVDGQNISSFISCAATTPAAHDLKLKYNTVILSLLWCFSLHQPCGTPRHPCWGSTSWSSDSTLIQTCHIAEFIELLFQILPRDFQQQKKWSKVWWSFAKYGIFKSTEITSWSFSGCCNNWEVSIMVFPFEVFSFHNPNLQKKIEKKTTYRSQSW